ncbi:MAG: PEGA domain-containing protein [Kofleriaceae bacterium]
MTAPIYLVSACTSGEEFISAFRRYADRNGVIFVPIGEPLPAGRKGRFAITLRDGGVMIEGHAEIVSSAKSPSVLYGRVGMTVKFLAPDEPSQTILAELEKARTSLRPPAPSVPARPADVKAEPRPRPPAPGGRIDAVNALAECVVIGDVSTLTRDSDLGTIPPPTGNTPAGPTPIPIAKSAPTPTPVPIAKAPSEPIAKPPATMPSSTMPPPFRPAKSPIVTPERPKSASMPPVVPPLPASLGAKVPSSLTATTLGMPPLRPQGTTTPAPNAPPPPATPKPLGIAPPPPVVGAPNAPIVPSREEAVAAALKFAQAVEARGALPDETVKGMPPEFMINETIRGTLPANALVVPPPLIQYSTPEYSDEKTDVTNVPAPASPARRTEIGIAVTPSGALVLPSAPTSRTPSDEETRETVQIRAAEGSLDEGLVSVDQVDPLGSTQAAIRLSKLQPTIEEPSGDWTMSTNDGQLTITARKAPADAAPPKGPPTGDYIIALDPSRPDGWSEPSKIEKRPEGELPGPPVSAVSSHEPLDSNARTQPELAVDEPKIQIDPTLIEPLTPMPALTDNDDVADPPSPMPPPPAQSTPMIPLAAPPPMIAHPGAVPIYDGTTTNPGLGPITPPRPVQGPLPGSFITPAGGNPQLPNASGPTAALAFEARGPVRGDLTDGGVGFFRESGDIPRLETNDEMSRAAQKRKRRTILIAASAAAALLLVIIVILATGGNDKSSGKKPTTSAPEKTSRTATAPKPEVAPAVTPEPARPEPVAPEKPRTDEIEMDVQPAAVVDTVKQPVEGAPPTDCTVTIESVPPGAELSIGGDAKGPTPVTTTLRCGVAAKVTLKKQRYQTTTREVTPKPNQKPIKIALARDTFTVKVSSSPQGAKVTLGGKTLGMTPTTVKVPAFETSTLRIAKDGYAPETQKVSPKNNNSSVNVTLKKTVPTKTPPTKTPPSNKKLR